MERCFSCAEIGNCTELYVRKPPDYCGPYFPSFERFNPPSSSNSISADGTVKVCGLCKIYLNSQWQNFDSCKIPESRRIYFTKRHESLAYNTNDLYASSHSESSLTNTANNPNNNTNHSKSFPGYNKSENSKSLDCIAVSSKSVPGTKNNLLELQSDKLDMINDASLDIGGFPGNNNKQLTDNYICCFVCGLPCLKWQAKTAYSSQMLENKEYFPFFEKLDPPQSSLGLTNGATKICIQCEIDLSKQWDHYEKLGTDQMSRIYHITNDHSTQFSLSNPGRFITNCANNSTISTMLKSKNAVIKCSLCQNKIIDSYKVSWNQRATCLYIPNLKNFQFPTEGVMVDKIAEETIICDVCHYFLSCETQSFNLTPLHLREYKLPKVGYLPPLFSASNETKSTGNSNRKPSLGSSLSAFLPADSYQQLNNQNQHSKRSRTPNLKNRSKTPIQQIDHGRCNSISKSSLNSNEQSIAGPIIANCHICLQELRDPNTLKTLRATSNDDYSDQPFFPFLKTLRTNSMKNNEFPVCVHCYYNMCGQWRMSHKASIPIYERKYNHNEFMCTQCQRLYAQKTDTLIVRDRLVCQACSDNKNSDIIKSSFGSTNQDSDANTNGLYAMKTKTTVTVTPISSELSIPSLASFNYAETMKQYSKTSISTLTTPSAMSNSFGQFVDSFSRNSSIPTDIYYNSKNIFGKSVKRPAVAAVAPNQRQNTPLLQSDSNPTQTDFSHVKMSELANFPGNYYSHNSAFNLFSGNISASSNNNSFAFPMFSSNSQYGIPSHSSIGRKHSSTNSDRDFLMKHTASFSSPYHDQKPRNNSLNSPANPFINWQQSIQQQPPNEFNPGFPFPQMSPMDSFSPVANNTSINKDAEMAMKIWMMSQNQIQPGSDINSKIFNSCFNNSQFVEEMTSSYWQMMLSSSLGAGRDDIIAPNLGPVPNIPGNTTTGNNLQSWFANAAIANYQYQMLQMIAAYQSSMATSPQQYPPGINKAPQISNWANQFNYNDPIAKLCRPEINLMDPLLQSKLPVNPNGFNELLKNPDFLKASFGIDHDKGLKTPLPINHSYNPAYNHPYQKHSMYFNNVDKIKPPKQCREEVSRTSECKTPTYSPKPASKASSHTESKKHVKVSCQSDVLDLSQNKSSRKSSYAIDSLTEHAKKLEKHNPKNSSFSVNDVSSIKTTPDISYSPLNNFDCALNMSNSWANNSSDETVTTAIVTKSLNFIDQPSRDQNYLMKILVDLNAHSLIDLIKSMPEILKFPETSSSTVIGSSTYCKNCPPTVWQFHQFFKTINTIVTDFRPIPRLSTRNKSLFMKQLGLEDSFTSKQAKNVNEMRLSMINLLNSSAKSKKTKHEIYWIKWILRNLKRRLSLKDKPHLRRSLMRPVLSGDIEVRFCAAKNKHELQNLRGIIKILIKYT